MTEPEVSELQEMEQRASSTLQRLPQLKMWAVKQSADLYAKAELMEQADEELEAYGETDPDEVRRVAEKIERIEGAFNYGI